jgi:hypothetical protein
MYNKDNLPVELKQYDQEGNLRNHLIVSVDLKRRITFMSNSVFDKKKHMISGFKKRITYKNDLDYGGKTIYTRYDSITIFSIVKPLVTNYERAMVTNPPDSLKLSPFYKKYIDADGIPIISSKKAPNASILIARDIVNFMLLRRQDVREELIRRRSRVLVMAETEMETDLPERSDWKKPGPYDPRLTPYERDNYDKPNGIRSMSDRQYWNQRARGMGGNEVSCAEENLLGYAGTKYYGENILFMNSVIIL